MDMLDMSGDVVRMDKSFATNATLQTERKIRKVQSYVVRDILTS
jgi:hypothetical protein